MTRTATNEPVQRRDRRLQARQDRKRNEYQRQRRERLKGYAIWGAVAAVVLAVVGLVVWDSFLKESPGQAVPSLGNMHVAPGEDHIPYNSDPPTSGPHFNNLARWGIHSEPIENELQVHNLEDGGVIVQYDCEDCEDLIKQLEAVMNSYGPIGRPPQLHWLLAPRKNMDAKIALTAWGRIDKMDEFDEGRIRKFIEAYRGIDHHPIAGERPR